MLSKKRIKEWHRFLNPLLWNIVQGIQVKIFIQASSVVCAVGNGWAQCHPSPVVPSSTPSLPNIFGFMCEFMNSASLTLRAQKKKKLIAVHTELLWGPKNGIFECLSFFLALLVFLAEVTVLLSPLAHLTPFFGWRLLSCHHTLLTLERVTPVALLVHSSVSSRCWRSQACQYFMHLKSNTLTHIWLLQVALHVSMLSLCRCAELLSLMYFQSGNANVIVSRQCDKEVLSRLWN